MILDGFKFIRFITLIILHARSFWEIACRPNRRCLFASSLFTIVSSALSFAGLPPHPPAAQVSDKGVMPLQIGGYFRPIYIEAIGE